MKAWQTPRGAQSTFLRAVYEAAPLPPRKKPPQRPPRRPALAGPRGRKRRAARRKPAGPQPAAPRSPAAQEPRRAPRGLSAAAQWAAPAGEVKALRPPFLDGPPAVLSGQRAVGRGCPPGADARAARGGEKRGPRTEDTAQGCGKGRHRRRKAPVCRPGRGQSGPRGAPSLAWIRGGPGEPRANPLGSRGAATSRRVCPGAPRAGGRAGEEPRGLAPAPRQAPGPGPPPSPRPDPPRHFSPAFPAPAHSDGLGLGPHRPRSATTVVAPVSLNPGP